MQPQLDERNPSVGEPLPRSPRLLYAAIGASIAWRLPSFWDPPWVNDEGTYFAVAQAMAHGYRLYAGVWENKPPALYLLYEAVYRLFGPSLVAMRLVALAAVVGMVLLTWATGRLFVDWHRASLAAMLVGLLLGAPVLEGTTANAELFLAVLTALGVYLALVKDRASPAGAAMACAVLFKAVAAFDALALGLWLLCRRPSLVRYAASFAVVLLAVAGMAQISGILPAMLRDAFLYDVGYVGHANGGGLPWLLLLKAAVLGLLTVVARRAPFPYLWLLYAGAGSLVSGRVFGHYMIQCIVPLSLVVVMQTGRIEVRRMLAAVPAAFVLTACLSALCGWAIASSGHDSILARRLQYYPNFVRYITGTESYAAYRDQIDDHVSRNLRVADTLRRLPPGPILVWGNVPWVYVLGHRLPATPYTSALRAPEVPGETETLRRTVRRGTVRAVVIVAPPAPALGSAVAGLRLHYRLVERVADARIYVSAR